MVSFGETDSHLFPKMRRHGIPGKDCDLVSFYNPNCHGKAAIFDTNHMVLRMRCLPKTNEDYAHLQHEIFHIVAYLMDRIGLKLSVRKSDEAYAYLIQYLTHEIYKKL